MALIFRSNDVLCHTDENRSFPWQHEKASVLQFMHRHIQDKCPLCSHTLLHPQKVRARFAFSNTYQFESKPTILVSQTRMSYEHSLPSKTKSEIWFSINDLSSCTAFQRTILTAECAQGSSTSTHFSGHLSLSDAQLKHCIEDGAECKIDKQDEKYAYSVCSGDFPICRNSREALNSGFVPSDQEDGQSCLFFVQSQQRSKATRWKLTSARRSSFAPSRLRIDEQSFLFISTKSLYSDSRHRCSRAARDISNLTSSSSN